MHAIWFARVLAPWLDDALPNIGVDALGIAAGGEQAKLD
jgi:hypothetical protein